MKDKTIRNIRLCLYTAIVLCSIWLLLMVIHFVQIFCGYENIDWSDSGLVKIGLIVLYIISEVVSVYLCYKIVLNIFRGLRENTVFPKSNVKLFLWLALAFCIYLLCRTNESILYDTASFRLLLDDFLIPFCILFFAFMYKVAADAVEENNLTI